MSARQEGRRPRTRRTRLFATCVPGLGRMLRRQLDAIDGIDVTGTGFDGHADIVFVEADRTGRAGALRSRLAEDVFAEIGRANRAGGSGAAAVASMAWRGDAVQRALSAWADEVQPLASSMTFRVTTRVLSEARFQRTDLRKALATLVSRDKPRWRFADPAQLEICVSEFHDGQYVVGLRLGGGSVGGQAGRAAAGEGPLPRTLAAAMVQLAGIPGAAGRTLLDPCCGTGVILAEAATAGWAAEGTDIDVAAVDAAARAAPAASVQLGDARELLLPDDYAGACVTRLPGPTQSGGPGGAWLSATLAELSRVTRSGGSVVLLAPALVRTDLPGTLRVRRQVPVRVAGTASAIWVLGRT